MIDVGALILGREIELALGEERRHWEVDVVNLLDRHATSLEIESP
jgi:hypothetical protein